MRSGRRRPHWTRSCRGFVKGKDRQGAQPYEGRRTDRVAIILAMQRTLAIVKPDAVERRLIGAILQRIEADAFKIIAMRLTRLSKADAEGFYAVHQDKRFFDSLTAFMASGPIVALALEAPDAINRWRRLMGATDPAKAERDTLRRVHGTSIQRNATHGSDAAETAAFEVGFFFQSLQLSRL